MLCNLQPVLVKFYVAGSNLLTMIKKKYKIEHQHVILAETWRQMDVAGFFCISFLSLFLVDLVSMFI